MSPSKTATLQPSTLPPMPPLRLGHRSLRSHCRLFPNGPFVFCRRPRADAAAGRKAAAHGEEGAAADGGHSQRHPAPARVQREGPALGAAGLLQVRDRRRLRTDGGREKRPGLQGGGSRVASKARPATQRGRKPGGDAGVQGTAGDTKGEKAGWRRGHPRQRRRKGRGPMEWQQRACRPRGGDTKGTEWQRVKGGETCVKQNRQRALTAASRKMKFIEKQHTKRDATRAPMAATRWATTAPLTSLPPPPPPAHTQPGHAPGRHQPAGAARHKAAAATGARDGHLPRPPRALLAGL